MATALSDGPLGKSQAIGAYVDRSTQPIFTAAPGATVDLSRFAGTNSDWWVNLTAVGSDGLRRTLATDLHFASTGSGPQNVLSQILAHG